MACELKSYILGCCSLNEVSKEEIKSQIILDLFPLQFFFEGKKMFHLILYLDQNHHRKKTREE